MLRDRRVLLALSVLISAALHGLLFYAAPRISLLRSVDAGLRVDTSVRLNIVDGPVEGLRQRDETGEEDEAPGSIDALMDEPVFEAPQQPFEPNPLPGIEERVAAESLQREHDLAPDDATLETIDAQILAISEEAARDSIDITRTLARAESIRIVGENEFPTLRGPVDMLQDEMVLIDPLRPGAGATDATATTAPGQGGEIAADRPDALPPPPGLPELPEEEVIARRPVVDRVAEESGAQMVDELVQFDLATYVPPGEPEGFFRLRIVPRTDQTLPVLPKDVTFVIDGSSSILQRKLDLTSRGLRDAIQGLRPEDRFNIVVFRETPNAFHSSPVHATPENIAAAEEFLKNIESRGETDVYNAIRPVLDSDSRQGVPSIVLVITDGRPTTGIKNGQLIINSLTDENDFQNSIFAFSAGRTVNRYLLDLLAYRNKGESLYLDEIEAMDDNLPKFFNELSDPLLVDVNTSFGRVEEDSVYPRNLPDFYRSRAVTVYGKFRPTDNGDFVVRMTGQARDEQKEVVFRADLADAERGGPDIARGWAFRKIYHLIAEMSVVGETPDLLAQVQDLSRQYNIQTVYSE